MGRVAALFTAGSAHFMTSPREAAKPRAGRRAAGLLSVAALAVAAPALAGSASDLFYERTLMSAAGARCRLFEPALGAALDAARIQARGAALRAGASNDHLLTVEQRARGRAAATACNSPDLKVAAGRVRSAFEGYARLSRITWRGDVSAWQGDRTITMRGPMWRLSQPSAFGADRMVFGLAGEQAPGTLSASVSFADGRTPYTARLVVRDVTRTNGPYLDRRRKDGSGRMPLTARTPPASATRAFAAESRSEAAERLRPAGTRSALLYRFPARAADALAGLDPREAVAVEFVFQGPRGDEVRRAYVEVGDFAAGRAFLAVPLR